MEDVEVQSESADIVASASPPGEPACPLSDDELLVLVRDQRASSISLRTDALLNSELSTALNYYKGEMNDVPTLEGRSKAISTDVNDAVETVLPDLVEIFVGGEDVVSFTPHGPEDEKQAEQETDYVKHVVFQQNKGFLNFYSAIKDAVLTKLGIFHFWREDYDKSETLQVEGQTEGQLELARQDGWELENLTPSGFASAPMPAGVDPATGQPIMAAEPLFDAKLVKTIKCSRVKVAVVPPEDFGAAKDATLAINEAPYLFMRSHPRAQDLKADGHDPDKVDNLPTWIGTTEDQTQTARDTVNEHATPQASSHQDMRQVEVVAHYVRILSDDYKLQLWRVLTGKDESVLLEKRPMNACGFAVMTPFPVTHRLYGRSVADQVIEVMRVRTALMRLMLDSGYFAVNRRVEINLADVSDTTVDDYLDNRPNRPVLSKTGNAIKPLESAALGFDVFGALEYMATVAEQRTGIVRNAQGLNPDTLHDTAAGAMALISAAQKRIRMIARIIAETGVRDLYLGVHDLLRQGPAQPAVAKLRGSWVNVDPTAWGIREEMDVQMGLGAGGQAHDVSTMMNVLTVLKGLIEGQGGPAGPMVTPENVYQAVKTLFERMGIRGVERFVTDPAKAMAEAATTPPAPPPPNPEMIKAQAEAKKIDAQIALEQQQFQHKAQLELTSVQNNVAIERYKADLKYRAQLEEMRLDYALKQRDQNIEASLGQNSPDPRLGGDVG